MLKLGDKEFGVYPIWLCPYLNKAHDKATGLMHPHAKKDRMYIDVGYYGLPTVAPVGSFDMMAALHRCEAWLMKNQGYVMLYAKHGLDEKSIEQMFGFETYYAARKTLKADKAFPTVFDKVKCG
mmetsp:Transcript_76108/g.174328  ORF Transcript_76108/g.174328 Transcript_76108/m.174328 type:complete len:124 (+) Transcript_76108:31-402(+)